VPITPARLAFAADGTPFSEAYGDVYHTAAGGIEQARHVFLAGNGLPERWQGRHSFTVLETGFGQGLNFLATWAAWRADPARPKRLHFLSVEKHPFPVADLALLHSHYPEVAELAGRLRASWPQLTPGFHRLEFRDGDATLLLTLAFGEAMAMVPQFLAAPEAIYLDGFAPARNPEMWSPQLLREIALLAAPGATAATWAVAGSVRDSLAAAGFQVSKQAGFAAKRQMLLAALPGSPAGEEVRDRRIAIVGAGLAGVLAAERLASRGWQVQLFDRQAEPAQETSGNLTAALLPVLSLDDNRLSRLNRSAYLYALRLLREWRECDPELAFSPCGVLQIARDPVHAAKQQAIVRRNAFPETHVRMVNAAEGAELAGLPVSGGGWWFAEGAWVNPASLCRSALTRAGNAVDCHWQTAVSELRREGEQWFLYGSQGELLGEVPRVLLANAVDIAQLGVASHLPIFRFRGQVSHLPAGPGDPLAGLRAVVCRDGYVTPAFAGVHCVGASFHRGGEPPLREEDSDANLERLERMLPGTRAAFDPASVGGRVGFRPVSPDKVPMIGELYRGDALPQGRDLAAVERLPGLFVATGYGARGATWAPLMGELLASQLEGEALPLEADLAGTVDPARFLARTVRERELAAD